MTLTADAHVHSEWSGDAGSDPASVGAMNRICERAVRIGLPAIVFTEHLDFEDAWKVDAGDVGEHGQRYVDDEGYVRLPTFNVDGYLAAIDRVNGSLHMLAFTDGERSEPTTLYRHLPADQVMWEYLAEIPRMVGGSDSFAVFTHIDYAVRSWPVFTAGPFDPRRFEEGFRGAMRSIAESGRALEMNTHRLWP